MFARVVVAALGIALLSACRADVGRDPILLDGSRLTVDNRTSQEWKHVELWLNTYYRVTAESIPPNTRFETSLNAFVAGFGQRFDFKRMQVNDLRLTATLPDGKPLELKYELKQGGLVDALGGAVGGKR